MTTNKERIKLARSIIAVWQADIKVLRQQPLPLYSGVHASGRKCPLCISLPDCDTCLKVLQTSCTCHAAPLIVSIRRAITPETKIALIKKRIIYWRKKISKWRLQDVQIAEIMQANGGM